MGGEGGLDRWQEGKFVVDQCGKQLGNQAVQSIHSEKSGRVWITTFKGLWLIEGGKLAPLQAPDSVRRLGPILDAQEDNSGHLWVFGPDFATRFPLHALPGKPPAEEPFFRDSVLAFCVASHGDFWIGTAQHGLYHWYEGEGTNFDRIGGISDGQIRTVYEDLEHNMWAGTTSGGLNRIRRRTIEIESVAGASSDQDTLVVAENAGKRIWVGTYAAGLFSSGSDQIGHFQREDGPLRFIVDFVPVPGARWLAVVGNVGEWPL